MEGDTAHEYAVRNRLTDNLVLTDTFEEAMARLSRGEHDAVLIQQLVGYQILQKLKITNSGGYRRPWSRRILSPRPGPFPDSSRSSASLFRRGAGIC